MTPKLTIQERVHLTIYKFVSRLLQAIPDSLGHAVRIWWLYAAPSVICCERCGSKFKQVFAGSKYYTQGINCAAESFPWDDSYFLQCYYGSRYDTNIYEFVEWPAEELQNLRAVCDDCVQCLVERNIIELVSADNFYFMTYNHG